MSRTNISTGSKWEPIIGYSRAVKFGQHVHVSGTTATDAEGKIVGPGDVHAQTVQALKNIESALIKAGAKMSHVYRTRLFVADITQWEAVGRAHGSIFGEIRPTTTMVEVSKLIDPAMLIEIEAEAFITD